METKPALAAGMVEEFVGVGRADYDRTKELLALEPGLINATWDRLYGIRSFDSPVWVA